tara:strand:+ start:739 stop:1050 length:312 start_codon:yes stop_codon:yes gene_type:complete
MNYLLYLKQPHFLALFCATVSTLIAFAESKYSKQKYDKKYYLKIFLLVLVNVYVVLILVKKGVVPMESKVITQSGGATGNNASMESSIQTSNYQSVDIGNPTF